MIGEWIQTGDKYSQDPDGYFWYCGRADDMLKVGGIWVSPVEVENTLVGHGAGLEDELNHFVKDKLAPYKYPRWIEFVPALPKTATGKIQRFKLT